MHIAQALRQFLSKINVGKIRQQELCQRGSNDVGSLPRAPVLGRQGYSVPS